MACQSRRAAISSVFTIVRTVDALRSAVSEWRRGDLGVALVPTMGALHAGHLALVAAARELCERVVVSIFVNPKQFAPGEDLERYPRREAEDAAALAEAGCDLLYAPDVAEIYPPGFATSVHVAGLAEGLCAAARPGHFDGVATVVAKLLNQVAPDAALFGEKDYQQLLVVRRLARDLDLPVRIVGVPTVREADGLALSSRNVYLGAAERARAAELPESLFAARDRLHAGEPVGGVLAAIRDALAGAGLVPEYVELRDAESLTPVAALEAPARLLAAVRIGSTRLIDNVPVDRFGGESTAGP